MNDIDLYAGGLSETIFQDPLYPTFDCIMMEQFARLKNVKLKFLNVNICIKNMSFKRINKHFRSKCFRFHTEFVSDLYSDYLNLKFMKPG